MGVPGFASHTHDCQSAFCSQRSLAQLNEQETCDESKESLESAGLAFVWCRCAMQGRLKADSGADEIVEGRAEADRGEAGEKRAWKREVEERT